MAERGFADPIRVQDVEESRQTVKPRREHDTRMLVIVAGIVGASVAVLFETAIIISLMIGGKL
jgi:hypothetical protein